MGLASWGTPLKIIFNDMPGMNQEHLIVIRGLEGNPPTSLTHLQSAILPYVSDIMIFWWGLWILVFAYMLVRHVILPALNKNYM